MGAMLRTTGKALAKHSFVPEIRVLPGPVAVRKRRNVRAEADPYRFGDCMETALTGLVFLAVFLFGAGLLRGVVPACAGRFWAEAALYGGAGASVALTLGLLARRLFRNY